MQPITLRPYQQKFIDDVRNEFLHKHKHVVGVAPCGAGKTIMTGWMTREATERGKRTIFFVHRHELIEQTSETFKDLGIEHGIISAGYPMQLDLPVQIASVQTLARRIDKIPTPDLIICDECHHILATTYKKIIDAFPKAYLLGVTATPLRMGGVTLCDVFTSMVEAPSVNELIQLGNLTKFEYFAPEEHLDLSHVKIDHGDYQKNDLANVMIDKRITGSIIEHYLKHAAGKSAICYCVNVEHSESVAAAFQSANIRAAHVDGCTKKANRDRLVSQFRQGDVKILCNAELFGEGFDVPHCQAVILARPTKSLTLFIQQSMRSMRPDPNDPNKVAVIIDHVQNCKLHGYPNDKHYWSLEPYTKGKLFCPKCNKLVKPKHLEFSWREYWTISGEQSQLNVVVQASKDICPQCKTNLFSKEKSPTTCRDCGEEVTPHIIDIKTFIDEHSDIVREKIAENKGKTIVDIADAIASAIFPRIYSDTTIKVAAAIASKDIRLAKEFIDANDLSADGDGYKVAFTLKGGNLTDFRPAIKATFENSLDEPVHIKFMRCPKCKRILDSQITTAPPKREAIYRDGELEKVHIDYTTETDSTEPNIKHKPKTIDEFIIIANRCGYKIGWAAIQALEYAHSYDDCLHIAQVCDYKKGWAWHQWQDIKARIDNKNCASLIDGARRLG